MAVVLVYALGYRGGGSPATTPQPPPTTTAAAAPPVFAVAGAAAQPSSYAATIRWTTPEPSTATLQWGPAGATPVLWRVAAALGTEHVVRLTGLAALTAYDVAIDAATPEGDSALATVAITTIGPPASPVGGVVDGTLRVGGEPFFPVIAWQQCAEQLNGSVAAGIDVFAGSQCLALPDLLASLHGRALVAGSDGADEAGTLGAFYPDEADARGYTGSTLAAAPQGVRFLTLTSHFFSGAAPLPAGRDMYPSLVAAADVVGFDLYPLQELCRPDMLPAVFDAQRELVQLAAGKPTFQWIEARSMKCGDTGPAAVTPATIRAESWLSLAGGARGLAYFPPDWQQGADAVVAKVVRRVRQIEPALLQPVIPVAVEASPGVRASARAYEGALYVIAVNGGDTPSDVRLTLPALRDRPLLVLGGERTAAVGGVISDRLPPLGVRIYVAPPE